MTDRIIVEDALYSGILPLIEPDPGTSVYVWRARRGWVASEKREYIPIYEVKTPRVRPWVMNRVKKAPPDLVVVVTVRYLGSQYSYLGLAAVNEDPRGHVWMSEELAGVLKITPETTSPFWAVRRAV